jgi:aminoglycoside phosphotransferase (APT) family kinase protein
MTDRLDGLGDWLRPRLGATAPVTVAQSGGPAAIGYSAETVVLTASYPTEDGTCERRLVLRAESPDPPVYPAQTVGMDIGIDIQRRVMEALAQWSDVPVAPILGAEPNPGVIGAPFFVMEYIEGRVPAVDPPYTARGFFADAEPRERTTMIEDGLRVLARVHQVDWRNAGLAWLIPPGASPTMARQVDLWESCATEALGPRQHPDMEKAAQILHQHLPQGSAPGLCWGDGRPGNMIWRDWRCVCATDFEAAAIAPPELDLGWWLMFDRCSQEVIGVPRAEGTPTREEQAAIYADTFGFACPEPEIRLHELFAAYRYCAIIVRVMNREVKRGRLPADHEIWRENMAVTCLRELIES